MIATQELVFMHGDEVKHRMKFNVSASLLDEFSNNRPFATIDHVSTSPIATGLWRACFPDSP
jgi:hypothetical protein